MRVALLAFLALGCSESTLYKARTDPSVSILLPLAGASFVEKEVITIWATIDDDQSSPEELTVSWSADGTELVGVSGFYKEQVSFEVTDGLAVGEHEIRVEVTDPDAMSGHDSVRITVIPNELPSLAFLAPEDDDVLFETLAATFTLQVTDPDTSDLSGHVITWTGIDSPAPTPGSDGIASILAGPFPVGSYTVDALVTDPGGATASASVTFQVTPVDADGDGFVAIGAGGDDCDDANDEIHPDAEEKCNGVDDDCDDEIDEPGAIGSGDYYADEDSDGYGNPDIYMDWCYPTDGWSDNNLDCEDDNPEVNPSAVEICDDGYDNDCDGSRNTCGLSGIETSVGVLVGSSANFRLGDAIAGLPDFDGADHGDILVGGPRYSSGSYSGNGGAWVYLGAPTGEVDVATSFLTITGEDSNDNAGSSVAFAGDLDLDGLSDILIGAPGDDDIGSGAGSVYLVYGRATGGTLSLASAGAKIGGVFIGDAAGTAVAGVGDFDDDGSDDILVGAPYADGTEVNAGAAYVLSGPIYGVYTLDAASFSIYGESMHGRMGWSLSGGDLDGDGISDILAGSKAEDDAGTDSGATVVVLGPATGTAARSDADAVILGLTAFDGAGGAVANVGDVNGDGYADFAIGAGGAGSPINAGEVYLFFSVPAGERMVSTADVTLSGSTSYAGLGASICGADIDGDGLSDILAGADGDDTLGSGAGAVYLFYGTPTGDVEDALLAPDDGGDAAGTAVGAVDLDGNGNDNAIVGAPGSERNGSLSGAAFVYLDGGW